MVTTVNSPYGPIDIEAREAQGTVSSVAIFNPAIKATDDTDNPVIVLALGDENLLVVDTDGHPRWRPVNQVQLDWRYDYKAEAWVDANGESLEAAE